MKKLVAIICILLAILLGMYIYIINIHPRNITISEVEKIEQFISKIYLWKEISDEALPRFNNINDAPDVWLWEVVKNNFEQYDLTYNEIQEKAKTIFGEDFTRQFPKGGTEYIYYNEELGKYFATGMGLDTLDDRFFIKNIKRTNNGYEVQIIEYLEDYSDAVRTSEGDNEEVEYNIYIRNLDMETIATVKNNENENVKIDKIKENIDKFSTKTLEIVEKDKNLYIKSVK